MNGPAQPEAVLGLDNVALELPLAGAGSRVLAAALDYAIVSVLVVGWVVGWVVRGSYAAARSWLRAVGLDRPGDAARRR